MQRMLYYHVISWCSWQFWKCLVLSVFIWEYHLRFELVSSHHYFDSGVQIAHVSRHFDKGCMSSELSVIGNATEKWHRHPEIMSKIKSKSQLAGLLDLCGAWASSEHSDDSQSSPQWSGVKDNWSPLSSFEPMIPFLFRHLVFSSYQWPDPWRSTQQSEARWLARDG